jgi:hypothetical protein
MLFRLLSVVRHSARPVRFDRMAVVEHELPKPPPPIDSAPPRKTRTPEERRVEVCPACYTALPAVTARCFFCE